MRRQAFAILLAVVTVFTMATMAWAAQPVEVSTTMDLQIHGPDFTTGSGTFMPFVSEDGKEMIPGGSFVDSAFAAGPTVHVTRTLSPDDGDGTIEIRSINFLETGQGKWVVVSATGDYAGLRGRGTSQLVSIGEGDEPGDISAIEDWVGSIHFDPARS